MAFQDEPHTETPVPPATTQEAAISATPSPNPELAPSEQFVFPEGFPTSQVYPNAPMPPSIVTENAPLFRAEGQDQHIFAGQTLPVAHSSYSNPPTHQLPAGAPQKPVQRKRLSAVTSVALVLTTISILLGGLVYYLAYYQPHQAQAMAAAQATATAQASQNIYTQATSGTPVLNDSLQFQGKGSWDEGSARDRSACIFNNGSYHVIAPNAGIFVPCYEMALSLHNFAFQVDLTITKGNYAGIFFRADSSTGRGYLFIINSAGSYYFEMYNGFKTDQISTIFSQTTRNMQSGKNQLTVIAMGNTFSFYLNQHFLTNTTDGTLASGLIALAADNDHSPTEVAFNNAKAWKLP